MGYSEIRNALLDYFTGVDGMQTLFKEAPWIIQGGDFHLNPGTTAGAVGFVHIDDSHETRITLPAYTGSKGIDYAVSLVFLYKYLRPPQLAIGVREDDWVTELDDLIDAIKAKIRADQNGGSPGLIFQMGDGADGGGGPDIVVQQDLPIDDGAGVFTLCRVEFHVFEIINA